jgi:hypothetical protein
LDPAGQPFIWKFENGVYDIRYKATGNVYAVDRILKSYTHSLYDAHVHSLEHIVEETFEWQSGAILHSDVTGFRFTAVSNLYSGNYHYNPDDWIGFPLLPKEILSDLEKTAPLEIQFRSNEKN